MIYLAGGIASFASANILGKMADQHGKLRVFSISIILSLFFIGIITNLPPIHFGIVLALFAGWFTLSTGRAVTAQAMVSNVVTMKHRGSFMSFNSSVQQLGTSLASFIAGLVVIKGTDGKILHYNWLGYISIFILVVCLLLAQYLFKKNDQAIS